MENIIVAIISAGGAILANQALMRRSLNEKDLEHAKIMQSYEDRIAQLEKENEEKKEITDRLNRIETLVVGLQKDIQYLKERK